MLRLACIVVLAPSSTAGEDVAEPEHLKGVALELFEEERYEEARALLDVLYRTNPDQQILYARAVVYKNLGDCDTAVALFEEFLRKESTRKWAETARSHMEDCGVDATQSDPTEAAVEPEPLPDPEPGQHPPRATEYEPSPPPEPPDLVTSRHWSRDPWGGALAGTGVVALGVGVGLVVSAGRIADRVHLQPSELAFAREVDRGRRFERVGFALTGVGSALIVGAAIRYIVVARRGR